MKELIMIINDTLTHEDKINIDKGYFFGYGVFETILVLEQPVLLNEHLNRLRKGLKVLNLNVDIDENKIKKKISLLGCKNEVLKICVSDNNVIYTKRKIPYNKENYEKGFSLKVSNIKRNPDSHAVYIKSFNYIDNLLERQGAVNEGYDDVLFLNTHNYITESSVSNIFFIKEDNQIYTPSIRNGLLEGTVRQWIVDRYKVIEGQYTLNDLYSSKAVFLTNSLMGIMKVSRINYMDFDSNGLISTIQNEYSKFLENYMKL